MADPKTWQDFVIAGIPAASAAMTAWFITYRLERQKQQMELYKALYLERIQAAKKLTELAGKIHFSMADTFTRNELAMTKTTDQVEERQANISAFMSHRQATRWLLGDSVYQASAEILSCVRSFNEAQSVGKNDLMHACLDLTFQKIGILNDAVHEMMLSDDLEKIVGRKKLRRQK